MGITIRRSPSGTFADIAATQAHHGYTIVVCTIHVACTINAVVVVIVIIIMIVVVITMIINTLVV